MRTGTARTIWLVLLLLFVYSMISCNAPGCSWEKATNGTSTSSRGLNRHHATCKLYQRSSLLASQKRQERAREAAARLTLTQSTTVKSGSTNSLASLFYIFRSTDISDQSRSLKSISHSPAPCAGRAWPLKAHRSMQIIKYWQGQDEPSWHIYQDSGRFGAYYDTAVWIS